MEKLYQCMRCLEFFQPDQIKVYVQLSQTRMGGLCFPCLEILQKTFPPKILDDKSPEES